jgi:plastocyanin
VGISAARAGELQIRVDARDGRPVGEVVVTATPQQTGAAASAPKSRERVTAIMDQQHKAFVPQVLVVGRGTWVEFPNNDSVSHQVYSFSPPKRFQLPLYKGEVHSPQQFDKAGLVVLGCNIHDSMVGYIYVADTPYFGTTDGAGTLRLKDLPGGRYQVSIWSPRVADDVASLSRDVDVDGSAPKAVEFKLRQALRSSPQPRPHPDNWDAY